MCSGQVGPPGIMRRYDRESRRHASRVVLVLAGVGWWPWPLLVSRFACWVSIWCGGSDPDWPDPETIGPERPNLVPVPSPLFFARTPYFFAARTSLWQFTQLMVNWV